MIVSIDTANVRILFLYSRCLFVNNLFLSLHWGKYTKEQQITTETILRFLGQESSRHIVVIFAKCTNKQTTEDRLYMESKITNLKLKSFLDKVGNRWVISPNPDVFRGPNDPVIQRHMNDLKSYIRLMPRPYTTKLFEKVRNAREEQLQEIELIEKKTGVVEIVKKKLWNYRSQGRIQR